MCSKTFSVKWLRWSSVTILKYVPYVLTNCAQSIYCVWICVLIINVQVKLLHCYVNDFVSFSGIGIELGNLSGHRTLITFCNLIANYMYIAHTFSWLFSQHGQGKLNFESGKSQGILKASMSGNPVKRKYIYYTVIYLLKRFIWRTVLQRKLTQKCSLEQEIFYGTYSSSLTHLSLQKALQ